MKPITKIFLAGLAALALIAGASGQEQEKQKEPGRKPEMKPRPAGPPEFTVVLNDLWYMQASAKVRAGGEQVSSPGLKIEGWYPALVPSTVLDTLAQNNVYPDIYFADNLKSVPEEPFRSSWWYRREFIVPGAPGLSRYRLEFDGINYRANIWLNGKLVADAETAFGAFRRFAFDITPLAKTGEKNVLAVEVIPPKKGEPTIGFVDWNPAPPDANMGLWREVRLRASGDVALSFPFVRTKLKLDGLDEARLTVSVELQNFGREKQNVELEGRLESARFQKKLEVMPGEKKLVTFTPEDTPELVIANPRVWWTHDLGQPELYRLFLTAKAGGKLSDAVVVPFGVREVGDYINEEGHRGFTLNGRKILVRGGGWTDDLLLHADRKKLAAEVRYARHMNLNTLRLEGFWGTSEELYNLCDANGILLMAGWSCHWEWEHYLGKPVDETYGGIISPQDIALISRSWEDQVKWLRNHPSIFVWAMASDKLPKPELEREYLRILKEQDPTRPFLVSTKGWTSEVSGPSAVKMLGPYDYVPPVYWYVDTRNGGAYGFNTETGPGPQVPPVESLKRMFPKEKLWPVNDLWHFHCCRGMFKDLDRYNQAMDRRLGPARDLEDYARKAQFLNYEGMRAMFEAFIANKGRATGVIQWMYNSAWPKLWWQLYDHFLMPNGAFYGARKANTPVHLIYNYGSGEILAVNNTLKPAAGLKAEVKLLDLELKELVRKSIDVSLAPDQRKVIDVLKVPPDVTSVYFLDLRLLDEKKNAVDINFYTLSAAPDVLDEEKTTWYVTPLKGFADFTALAGLKPAQVRAKVKFSESGPLTRFSVELENRGPALAFQLELMPVRDLAGGSVLPVFMDDNYVHLLPGEKRRLSGSFLTEDLKGDRPALSVEGWNVQKFKVR